MVLNRHYGTLHDLPFDLRHKADPITYKLSPFADRRQIDVARQKLKGAFVARLRPYLKKLEFSGAITSRLHKAEDRASDECANRARYTVHITNPDRVNFHKLLATTIGECERLGLEASVTAAYRCIAEFQDGSEWIKIYHRFRFLIEIIEDDCDRKRVTVIKRQS